MEPVASDEGLVEVWFAADEPPTALRRPSRNSCTAPFFRSDIAERTYAISSGLASLETQPGLSDRSRTGTGPEGRADG